MTAEQRAAAAAEAQTGLMFPGSSGSWLLCSRLTGNLTGPHLDAVSVLSYISLSPPSAE